MSNLENVHKYNLFYGLQEGELKHISEVENGLKCKCFCPACKKKLVAKNGGQKRTHHFAHYESAECKFGVQTSIHIAAKQILEKSGRLKIPAVSYFINTEIEKSDDHFISHGFGYSISEAKYIQIDNVILEKKLHKYIPDVVVFSKDKRLIVEIAVTHFVGRKKLEDIISSNISAIEIDLSKIEKDFDLDDLEKLVIDNIENKSWLHNQYGKEMTLIKRDETRKEIQAESIKKSMKREKREEWYKQYYKPVVYREISVNYTVQQIKNCPLKKRKFEGSFYASVKKDCFDCQYSRRLREDAKYLVCLYDYYEKKIN